MASAAQHQEAFQQNRSYLLGLAYRMLGSFAEAEDIVQEAWIRWQRANRDDVAQPRAFLRKVATRLCLDHLKSARVQREEYVGPWLPEAVPDYVAAEIAEPTLADDITMGLLLALERLSPPERAAFLLHDMFEVPFAEIAAILDKPETACRQLATRARQRVQGSRRRFDSDRAAAERLTNAFLIAAREGDIEALKSILAEDVVVYTDGGGKRPAALNLISGLDRVSRFFAGLHKKRLGLAAELIYRGRINAAPGFITLEPDGLPQAVSIEAQDGKIAAIYIVRNPDKLRLVQVRH
jgi:RNA polymerase sigma-70 factor, ECF subfamily